MVCLRFCQHSDVTFLKEFQQRLNSRYLASTFFSLYTLISLNTLVTFNRTSVSATSPNTLRHNICRDRKSQSGSKGQLKRKIRN